MSVNFSRIFHLHGLYSINFFYADVCLLTKDPGPCSDDELRFYYDSSTGECRPFSYRGCQGNANNFQNPEECYGYCGRGAEISRRIYSPGKFFFNQLCCD